MILATTRPAAAVIATTWMRQWDGTTHVIGPPVVQNRRLLPSRGRVFYIYFAMYRTTDSANLKSE